MEIKWNRATVSESLRLGHPGPDCTGRGPKDEPQDARYGALNEVYRTIPYDRTHSSAAQERHNKAVSSILSACADGSHNDAPPL